MAYTRTHCRPGHELYVRLQQPSGRKLVHSEKGPCYRHHGFWSKHWYVKYVVPICGEQLLKPRKCPAGLIYPIMFKILVAKDGFPTAVRYLAILVGGTSFIAFVCAVPNPTLALRVPEKWLKYEVWVDQTAFHRRPYRWFVAAMCFVFLGFYPIFFQLEDWAQWKGIGIKEDIANGTGGLHGESGFRTFYFLSIMNACSTVGRILGAYLSDQYVPLPLSSVGIASPPPPTEPKDSANLEFL